ncbi:MAG: regulatory protein GemA [Alphaproteobacteria bacterium]|nr:regulatory protein GemA [Alphaproteobacteria bacterium]
MTKVLEEFKRLGWKPSKKQIFKKAVNPQARKIYALWGELKRLKAVENGDRKALRAFVKRMTNKEAPEWLLPQESYLVIEALKKWIERVE